MNTRAVVIGATMGSALMFLLDPDRGRRRRALVRDKATWAARKTRDGLDATRRDIANRATGVAAAARRRRSKAPVDDERLVARARAALGHVSSRAGEIDILAQNGCVTVRGPVLASDASAIVAAIASVPGVLDVVDELDAGEQAGGMSVSQEHSVARGARPWNRGPAKRTMVGAGLLAAGVWMAVAATRTARAHLRQGSGGQGDYDGGYADAAL